MGIIFDWTKLTDKQKETYKEYCDDKFGKTIVCLSNGEPLYLDKDGRMIDSSLFIKLLFEINDN